MILLLRLFAILNIFSTINSELLCGSSEFTANGQESKDGMWPWLAALFEPQTQKFFCGGVVIAQNMVLTVSYDLDSNSINSIQICHIYNLAIEKNPGSTLYSR